VQSPPKKSDYSSLSEAMTTMEKRALPSSIRSTDHLTRFAVLAVLNRSSELSPG
jgi:hypothetical protein